MSDKCPHPARRGVHEGYTRSDGTCYCRACGKELQSRSVEQGRLAEALRVDQQRGEMRRKLKADLAAAQAEAARLRGAAAAVPDAWDWWQVDPVDRCASVPGDAIDELRAALSATPGADAYARRIRREVEPVPLSPSEQRLRALSKALAAEAHGSLSMVVLASGSEPIPDERWLAGRFFDHLRRALIEGDG